MLKRKRERRGRAGNEQAAADSGMGRRHRVDQMVRVAWRATEQSACEMRLSALFAYSTSELKTQPLSLAMTLFRDRVVDELGESVRECARHLCGQRRPT